MSTLTVMDSFHKLSHPFDEIQEDINKYNQGSNKISKNECLKNLNSYQIGLINLYNKLKKKEISLQIQHYITSADILLQKYISDQNSLYYIQNKVNNSGQKWESFLFYCEQEYIVLCECEKLSNDRYFAE